ncbi:MAG: DUF1641 domain-containing protein [Desulfurococcales archaeon]|nr:DUF1641 domain-containing protein [Desulfurococcales archaeon]MCE4621907.1 DUF1641 domain-containing protein [Desulfurococcales archaeon]MCE4626025.1 DUF1641 domain-containing protein [Desulfurococcales archaeon]MCE4628857.1 DUF1641 domain-containing protein [Desulfurococcales archaeon]NOZ31215.1 DUF1641 domain-containing protein [Thermoproteota archaeon]
MSSGLEFNEVEVQALKDLLEVALELKRSGLLGMLKELLSSTESIMEGMQSDLSTFRLGLLLGAILEAARRLDGEKAISLKMNTEDASYCLFNSLAATKPGEVQPKGMMGLMSALRDPDVQKGIGYLIAIAKNLGACLNQLK